MNKPDTSSSSPEQEKLLYKLVLQFLIFNQNSHKLLEPHLKQIGKELKSGASLHQLIPKLQAISKTLLHISRQTKASQTSEPLSEENHYLLKRIDGLLADSDVPLRFQRRKDALRLRTKSNRDEQSFNQVIDSTINLLLDIKQYASTEQTEIDSFLNDLGERLTTIEEHAEQTGQVNRIAFDQRQHMDSELNQHLNTLKNDIHKAEELTSLKATTSLQLDYLMQQLLEHKQREQERQLETQQQIIIMTEKLQSLELETASLRTRLKIEHDRALCDALTGLPNHLAYKDRIEMETARWNRYREPLALVIWDIDYFKRINDNYGHKAGDKTLALVAQLLQNNCRSTDFVARYGGEEFVMLMPKTQANQALGMAEKLRDTVAKCGFNHNGNDINLTISCGISEFSNSDHHEEVFVRADQALYQAKKAGRNCCKVFVQEPADNV